MCAWGEPPPNVNGPAPRRARAGELNVGTFGIYISERWAVSFCVCGSFTKCNICIRCSSGSRCIIYSSGMKCSRCNICSGRGLHQYSTYIISNTCTTSTTFILHSSYIYFHYYIYFHCLSYYVYCILSTSVVPAVYVVDVIYVVYFVHIILVVNVEDLVDLIDIVAFNMLYLCSVRYL